MTRKMILAFLALAVAAAPSAARAEGTSGASRPGALWLELQEREQEARDRETELYDDGTEAIDEGRWDKAAAKFDQLARMGGSKADAALYWKAYAENKQGRRADALATVAQLKQAYPKSRWLDDAKALEIEVRQQAGQPPRPEAESDEELKLLALNGLAQSDPAQAVPLLEKFLSSGSSPKLKQRALFVLAQIGTPDARAVIVRIAKGQANPELQRRAVEYLGLFGGKDGIQALSDIYASSSDVDVKRQILRSFMVAGQRDRVLAAAKGEKAPELRGEAIRQLGVMGAQDELWQLYQNEPSVEIKKQILQAMFVGGNADRLAELARTEPVKDLQLRAIRNLGLMGTSRTGAALDSLYASDKDPDVRREIIKAFFLQGNVKGLIDIARKETDPGLKKAAVGKLSLMHSKEATDFLMEILKQ